jgi:hypothetical protein
MQGMGYGEQPYAVFLHTDREHLHLHVVSSRVSASNFRKVDDYCERWRSQCVGAIIERKYGLTSVLDQKLPAALKRMADGYFERQQRGVAVSIGAYFKNWRRQPDVRTLKKEVQQEPKMSNKVLLQVNAAVAAAMKEKPRSLAQLKKMLAAQRVEVREVLNRQTGKQQGVVFALHRQDVKDPTVEAAEKGIPSGQLPCFSEVPLMQQLLANRRAYKAAQSYLRKRLPAALKRAKSREELDEMLQQRDILTTWHSNARGVYGVSFTYRDVTLKGVQVGKAFSFEKISALLERNGAAPAHRQQTSSPRFGGIGGGSIGGSGGGKNDDDEDEDEEVDEVTGRRIKTKRH